MWGEYVLNIDDPSFIISFIYTYLSSFIYTLSKKKPLKVSYRLAMNATLTLGLVEIICK